MIVILRREPHSAITQLRVIPLCESSFLEVHLMRGMTFWVPTHAPQPLVSPPRSAPTLLLHHAPGLPLGLALSWAVSTLGVSLTWRGTSRVRILPTDTRTMAFWSHLSLLFVTVLGYVLTWRCFNLATPSPGDALLWRRLLLATPHPGDTSSWRRLILATPHLGDASSWRRLILATPYLGDASSWRWPIFATPQAVSLLTSFLGLL